MVAPVGNPIEEGMRVERTPEPCVTVIFGASGDLTRRKLMPALYNSARDHLLAPGFSIVGFSRSEMGDDGFRASMKSAVEKARQEQVDEQEWHNFADGLYYLAAHPGKAEDYARLKATLSRLDQDTARRPESPLLFSCPSQRDSRHCAAVAGCGPLA